MHTTEFDRYLTDQRHEAVMENIKLWGVAAFSLAVVGFSVWKASSILEHSPTSATRENNLSSLLINEASSGRNLSGSKANIGHGFDRLSVEITGQGEVVRENHYFAMQLSVQSRVIQDEAFRSQTPAEYSVTISTNPNSPIVINYNGNPYFTSHDAAAIFVKAGDEIVNNLKNDPAAVPSTNK